MRARTYSMAVRAGDVLRLRRTPRRKVARSAKVPFSLLRRSGRAAEGGGLENRWPARARRFESCLLRHPSQREIPGRLARDVASMSSNLLGLLISAIGAILFVAVAVGLP